MTEYARLQNPALADPHTHVLPDRKMFAAVSLLDDDSAAVRLKISSLLNEQSVTIPGLDRATARAIYREADGRVLHNLLLLAEKIQSPQVMLPAILFQLRGHEAIHGQREATDRIVTTLGRMGCDGVAAYLPLYLEHRDRSGKSLLTHYLNEKSNHDGVPLMSTMKAYADAAGVEGGKGRIFSRMQPGNLVPESDFLITLVTVHTDKSIDSRLDALEALERVTPTLPASYTQQLFNAVMYELGCGGLHSAPEQEKLFSILRLVKADTSTAAAALAILPDHESGELTIERAYTALSLNAFDPQPAAMRGLWDGLRHKSERVQALTISRMTDLASKAGDELTQELFNAVLVTLCDERISDRLKIAACDTANALLIDDITQRLAIGAALSRASENGSQALREKAARISCLILPW